MNCSWTCHPRSWCGRCRVCGDGCYGDGVPPLESVPWVWVAVEAVVEEVVVVDLVIVVVVFLLVLVRMMLLPPPPLPPRCQCGVRFRLWVEEGGRMYVEED